MKILAVQNRMGIGDMVIFLPFIESISKKFGVPVSLLVKDSSKADELTKNNNHIGEILILKRSNSSKKEHDGIKGSLRLIKEIKKKEFHKVFIFNSSLRYKIIFSLARVGKIYQFPLFQKKNQDFIEESKKLLFKELNLRVECSPRINLNLNKVKSKKLKKHILLGIGGSGPTKRISSTKFKKLIELFKIKYDCHFFLGTGKSPEEQIILNDILKTNEKICTPLDSLKISETFPIISQCDLAVCNDTSFSHISAALGVNTIVLMSDTPLMYGNYSPFMHPVLPDGIKEITHGSNAKDKINPQKIFEKVLELIN